MIRRGTRILVVEDDQSIARLLQLELQHRGMEVIVAANGPDGLDAVDRLRPDLVLLDILLPGLDGERVLARIRARDATLPILMLTARDSQGDKVRNLTTGADDYLTKPFDIEELVARMGAVLRRVHQPEVVRIGGLEIALDAATARRDGVDIPLTAREFELLAYLARNANQVLTRDMILDRVWQTYDVDPNVVDVYVGYLRRKLDQPGTPTLIRTIRGVGFTLRES